MLLSSKHIIANSVTLYKDNWRHLLELSALFLIPSLGTVATRALFVTPTSDGFGTILGADVIPYAIFTFIFSLLSLFISIALLKALVDAYEGKPTLGIQETLKWSWQHLLPAFIVSVIVSVIVFFGLLLLIIPGIILSIYYTFAFFEVVIDNKRGMAALRDSKALVKGKLLDVFVRLALPLLFFIVAFGLLQWLVTLPLLFIPGPLSQTLVGLIAAFFAVIATPPLTAAPSILYVELKRLSGNSSSPESMNDAASSMS